MGRQQSLRNKAAHFESDLTTVILNPISDKPSKPHPHPPTPHEDVSESKIGQLESINEKGSGDLVDGPDTSSFSAFLYSLLLSSETEDKSTSDEQENDEVESGDLQSDNVMKESGGKKSLFSRGKQSVYRAMYKAARMGGYTIIL